MNRQQILEFLNKTQTCHLATVEDGEPRVRGMMMYRADESGILFHTGTGKDLYRQIQAQPAVELCFNDLAAGIQVRVRGRARVVGDRALKEEIVAARDFMKPWIEKYGYDLLGVFRVTECRATVWTFATNFVPKEFVALTP
ncbi:MAG: pyridoxamine 5'-phosphate oxidase family protein [Kiritimatiellae bacterium]|nr:pyridoxamine 5'-phosphate oxidase family protein [Kiritimatiellia bacterium]